MAAELCKRAHCRTALVIGTDGNGRATAHCPACARNRRGLCRDCPGHLAAPNAMRCRSCAKMEKRRPTKRPRSVRNRRGLCDRCPSPLAAPNARWCPSCARELGRQRNQVYKRRKYRTDVDYRETQKQEKRERYRHDPAFRAHVIARNAKANAKRKRTDLDRLIQRVYQRGRMADPEYRAMINARAAKRSRERYATDPVYRERLRAKGRRISAKRRARLRQQPESIAA